MDKLKWQFASALLVLMAVVGFTVGVMKVVKAYPDSSNTVINVAGNYNYYAPVQAVNEPTVGYAEGTGTHFLNELTVGTGLNVDAGGMTVVGTSTLDFTPNQVNVASTSLASASTTPSALQNTSGFDRVISYGVIDLNAGSSADNVARLTRMYVSFNRAGTTTAQVIQEISLATSTLRTTLVATTTLGVVWPNGYWVNVTTTGSPTSTGVSKVYWHGF